MFLLLLLPLAALLSTASLSLLAINGFFGPIAKAKAEDIVLSIMGESRGSYALKNMTPFQNHPLHAQTNKIVDVGQAGYVTGRDTTTDISEGMGKTMQGVGSGVSQGVEGTVQDVGSELGKGVCSIGNAVGI